MARTILIVDDDVAIVDVLAETLEGEGYRVLRAGDGLAALAMLNGVLPDLLLTDNMMPRMSGVELIAYLHERPALAVPVILMSAAVPVAIPPRTTFLPKPFSLDTLLALVAERLAAP